METKVEGFYAPGNMVDLRGASKTFVVAMGHKARHGKDTACDYLIERYGAKYKFRKYSFAEALKREVASLGDLRAFCSAFGVPYDEAPPLDDPFCPGPHGKQRRLLQVYGTEFRRVQDPDYWVKRTMERIKADSPRIALISDMRFKNEFAAVKAIGGVTVRVERPGFTSGAEGHVSETELDDAPYDYIIRSENLRSLRCNLDWIFGDIIRNFSEPFAEVSSVAE
jgi:hypothetical protein